MSLRILLFACALFTSASFAKEIRLYSEPGEFGVGQSATPFAISPGDTLAFSNGYRFHVKRVLGGNNNLLLDVGDGKVVRIPMSALPGRKKLLADSFRVINSSPQTVCVRRFCI